MNRNSTPAHAKHAAPAPSANVNTDAQETQLIPQQASSVSAATEAQTIEASFDDFDLSSVNNQAVSAADVYVDRDDQTQVLNPVQNVPNYDAAAAYSAPTQAMPAQAAYPQNSYAQLSRNAYNQPAQMNPVDLSPKKSRRGRAGKVVAITLACIVALVAAVYLAGSFYFSNHFLPNTTAGSIDLSLMSDDDAENAVDNSLSSYNVDISGQGLNLSLSAKDAGLSIDSAKVVQSMQNSFNQWKWPLEITKSHDLTSQMVATVNGTGLEDKVKAAVDTFNESARQPTNAYVAYSQDKKAFVINPETFGTAIDASKVVEEADEALAKMESKVKLDDSVLVQPAITSDNAQLASACDTANSYLRVNMDLQMGGASVGTLNADAVSQWVTVGDDFNVNLNQDSLNAWVDTIATNSNTVGTTRTYTRPDGKEVTVSGGSYGWEIDNESLKTSVNDAVTNGSTGVLDVPVFSSGAVYNGVGGVDWGRYIDIDISQQYVRYYDESGNILWESACITGKPDGEHNTPAGVYWLNGARTNEKLEGYENGVKIYTSYVSYWMPFVGNAIGLHDANWQPSFGGTMYQDGYGSHGCVNLPPANAASLYNLIVNNGYVGDCVISHY